ncbi:hypothetical protein JMJ77_0000259 [Colletotrichum scovillei]|uniref:Uncharacterized protein n=1 Tax=Colletotrichum scovillei TaxID=1209932 RepID=A0A9P7UE38_9PEZI|nr:hypothetical protein JMJ77_0000259 [Colletotrichum scovillei]KAG7071465.1 hypothetical protein JMJ76_0004337 [Colletotrichum scovillei]KAG7079714.1 hypothetical protein JMJ78_0006819 [Colletotrichum scovillei]
MGLRLHSSSSDALDLDLTQRYLPLGPSQVGRPHPRAHYNGAYFHPDGSIALHRELADQKLPLLDLVLTANHQKRARRHRQTRRGQTRRSTRQWRTDEAAEGRTLASGGHRLPGDHRRTPSLERQDAFRDPRTTKARLYAEDAPDIEELYRMGLLYDDEHLRGSAFGLDIIDHYSEPEYTMRPAKRARKSKPQQISYDDDLQLALDLSLAELGRDESFAQFLCSPELDELPSGDESDSSSTYSARLAPLQFVSELLGSPDYFSDNMPELTTDSASDSSISFNYSSDEEPFSADTRGTLTTATKSDEIFAQKLQSTWMMSGDGS